MAVGRGGAGPLRDDVEPIEIIHRKICESKKIMSIIY